MTSEATELLKLFVHYPVIVISAAALLPAAELVRNGYAIAHDDAEGIWLEVTESGKLAAQR